MAVTTVLAMADKKKPAEVKKILAVKSSALYPYQKFAAAFILFKKVKQKLSDCEAQLKDLRVEDVLFNTNLKTESEKLRKQQLELAEKASDILCNNTEQSFPQWEALGQALFEDLSEENKFRSLCEKIAIILAEHYLNKARALVEVPAAEAAAHHEYYIKKYLANALFYSDKICKLSNNAVRPDDKVRQEALFITAHAYAILAQPKYALKTSIDGSLFTRVFAFDKRVDTLATHYDNDVKKMAETIINEMKELIAKKAKDFSCHLNLRVWKPVTITLPEGRSFDALEEATSFKFPGELSELSYWYEAGAGMGLVVFPQSYGFGAMPAVFKMLKLLIHQEVPRTDQDPVRVTQFNLKINQEERAKQGVMTLGNRHLPVRLKSAGTIIEYIPQDPPVGQGCLTKVFLVDRLYADEADSLGEADPLYEGKAALIFVVDPKFRHHPGVLRVIEGPEGVFARQGIVKSKSDLAQHALLVSAVDTQDVQAVTALLKNQKDSSIINRITRGQSVLSQAVDDFDRNAEIAMLLIEHGGNPLQVHENVNEKNSTTPFNLAVYYLHAKVVDVMLHVINRMDAIKRKELWSEKEFPLQLGRALFRAVVCGANSLVKVLLKHGADPNLEVSAEILPYYSSPSLTPSIAASQHSKDYFGNTIFQWAIVLMRGIYYTQPQFYADMVENLFRDSLADRKPDLKRKTKSRLTHLPHHMAIPIGADSIKIVFQASIYSNHPADKEKIKHVIGLGKADPNTVIGVNATGKPITLLGFYQGQLKDAEELEKITKEIIKIELDSSCSVDLKKMAELKDRKKQLQDSLWSNSSKEAVELRKVDDAILGIEAWQKANESTQGVSQLAVSKEKQKKEEKRLRELKEKQRELRAKLGLKTGFDIASTHAIRELIAVFTAYKPGPASTMTTAAQISLRVEQFKIYLRKQLLKDKELCEGIAANAQEQGGPDAHGLFGKPYLLDHKAISKDTVVRKFLKSEELYGSQYEFLDLVLRECQAIIAGKSQYWNILANLEEGVLGEVEKIAKIIFDIFILQSQLRGWEVVAEYIEDPEKFTAKYPAKYWARRLQSPAMLCSQPKGLAAGTQNSDSSTRIQAEKAAVTSAWNANFVAFILKAEAPKYVQMINELLEHKWMQQAFLLWSYILNLVSENAEGFSLHDRVVCSLILLTSHYKTIKEKDKTSRDKFSVIPVFDAWQIKCEEVITAMVKENSQRFSDFKKLYKEYLYWPHSPLLLREIERSGWTHEPKMIKRDHCVCKICGVESSGWRTWTNAWSLHILDKHTSEDFLRQAKENLRRYKAYEEVYTRTAPQPSLDSKTPHDTPTPMATAAAPATATAAIAASATATALAATVSAAITLTSSSATVCLASTSPLLPTTAGSLPASSASVQTSKPVIFTAAMPLAGAPVIATDTASATTPPKGITIANANTMAAAATSVKRS